jgi:hypothetical protein
MFIHDKYALDAYNSCMFDTYMYIFINHIGKQQHVNLTHLTRTCKSYTEVSWTCKSYTEVSWMSRELAVSLQERGAQSQSLSREHNLSGQVENTIINEMSVPFEQVLCAHHDTYPDTYTILEYHQKTYTHTHTQTYTRLPLQMRR